MPIKRVRQILRIPGISTVSELTIKLKSAEAIVERLAGGSLGLNTEKQVLVDECKNWLAFAGEVLEKSPMWRRSFAADSAYACLHQVRNRLCVLLPFEQLYLLLEEIRLDLPYIRDQEELQRARGVAEEILVRLGTQTPLDNSDGEENSEDKLRYDLSNLSALAAYHREMVWHKVNLMRARLFTMLLVLIGLLVFSIFLLPYAIGGIGNPPEEVHWYQIWALQILGAMGGALSALMTREPLSLHIAQYYLKQTVLHLRPAVGAAAGLSIGLLQLSGVISVFPQQGDGQDWKWIVVLLVAFLAGFSERLFLGQLDKLIGEKASSETSEELPPTSTPPKQPTSPKGQT
jgi:hypothetical protein